MNEEWCGFLAENGFLTGLSVDGIRQTHDRHRHFRKNDDSAFDVEMKAAELLDRAGAEYNILTVVNSDRAANIGSIYQFYREQGWY